MRERKERSMFNFWNDKTILLLKKTMHNFMLLIDKLQFFKRIINFNENK